MEQNIGPFSSASFFGSAKVNGIPVWNHQLPVTVGGIMGDTVTAAPPKFGRLVSINPSNPDVFLMGIPSGAYPVGILIMDPAIQENEPGAFDVYVDGRPATACIFGMVQFNSWDVSGTGVSAKPGVNQKVAANVTTGEIAFFPRTTTVPATHKELNAAVVSKAGPNGVTVFFNSPIAAVTTSEAIPQLPDAVVTIPGGAVAADTVVALKAEYIAMYPGATLNWKKASDATWLTTDMTVDAAGAYDVKVTGTGYTESDETELTFTILS